MILYFSGTGNSRWCAELLEKRLGDESVDTAPFLKTGEGSELTSERPWIFAAPTYAWRLPRIYSEWMQKSRFYGSRNAYFVMTCGMEIGNAAEENRALCQSLGLHYQGTLTVVMPENYIALFDVPKPAEISAMMREAKAVVETAADCILRNESIEEQKPGLAARLKSGPVNPLFYKLIVKAKKFYAKDTCISCGKCVKGCVLGNIQLRDGRPVWGDRCTHCMACICGCPTEAIEYGKASFGKVRYQCPHFEE